MSSSLSPYSADRSSDLLFQFCLCSPREFAQKIADPGLAREMRTKLQRWRRIVYLMRWNWSCAYCVSPLNPDNVELDHVIPEAIGGRTEVRNLVPACGRCNRRKGNRDAIDFMAEDLKWTTRRIAAWHRRSMWLDETREAIASFPAERTGFEFDESDENLVSELRGLPPVNCTFTMMDVVKADVLLRNGLPLETVLSGDSEE